MTVYTTSRFAVVTDALLTALRASALLTTPTVIFDGPLTVANEDWTQAIFVGFDGNWSGEFEAVEIAQEMKYLGNTTMEETLDVRCCAYARSYDPNMQALRNITVGLLEAAEVAVRTDPTLGIDGSTVAQVEIRDRYFQEPTANTVACRIPFIVHVTTWLLSV